LVVCIRRSGPYDDGSICTGWVDIAQAFVRDELK
jgi:hypothetical protein